MKLGVFRPVTVYPFYESASSAHWGRRRVKRWQSPELWSRYSEAAAENPNAWLKRRYAPDEITTPTADNRLIAWPYNKLMVANPSVNMGGALLLTTSPRRARPASPRTSWSTRWAAPRPKSRAIISCATSSMRAIRRTRC